MIFLFVFYALSGKIVAENFIINKIFETPNWITKKFNDQILYSQLGF